MAYHWTIFVLTLLASLCVSAQDANLSTNITAATCSTPGPVRTVARFPAAQAEFPEGLAIDKQGNIYAALTVSGKVWKRTLRGEESILATLDVGSHGGFLVGLAVDAAGVLYVIDGSAEKPTHGVWKVTEDGSTQFFAPLDPTGFPNGMAFDADGNLLVTDSSLGQIYKITPSGVVSVWVKDPMLDPINGVGANGIEFRHGNAYVANTDRATIVLIPVVNGRPGKPRVWVQSPVLSGADGIAFDDRWNLYVAVDRHNTIVEIKADGEITILARPKSRLDYPASTSFGQTPGRETVLYWTNSGINFGTPSIQRMDVCVPGVPLP
jgi:sugar lactone lactonase YvrE